MQKKVTIIGAGAVGATTAFALLTRGAASEVVLIDVNTEKAKGEALDIKQATPFIDNCDIHAQRSRRCPRQMKEKRTGSTSLRRRSSETARPSITRRCPWERRCSARWRTSI